MKSQSEICKARSLFITRGILNRDVIPDHIVYSWVRSKLHNISFELLDVHAEDEPLDLLSFNKDTSSVLQVLRKMSSEHSIVYLINSEGRVVYNTADKGFILPGFTLFLEEAVGTTAAGISLVTGENTKVYGCEHYNKSLTNYVSESLVIEGTEALIIMVLTPILHFVSHQTLYTKVLTQFKKEEEGRPELTKKEVIGHEKEPVNPVKTVEKPFKIISTESYSNTVETNVCKVFTLSVVEEETIRAAIDHYHGNLKKAAEALGIGRSTLYRKIKEYKINKD